MTYNHTRYMLLGIFMMSFSLSFGQQCISLTDVLLNYSYGNVQRIMQKERNIRYAALCSVLCMVGYAAYKVYMAPVMTSVQEVPQSVHGDAIHTNLIDNHMLLNAIEKQQSILQQQSYDIQATKQLLYNAGYTDDIPSGNKTLRLIGRTIKSCAGYVVNVGIGTVILKILSPFNKYFGYLEKIVDNGFDRIFHEDNTPWFIAAKLHDISSATLLMEYAQQYDALITTGAKAQKETVQNLFVHSWNVYMHQVALLVGFLRYKMTLYNQSNPSSAHSLALLIEDFVGRVEARRQEIEAHIAQQTTHASTSVAVLVDHVIKDMQLLIKNAGTIEYLADA